MAHGIALYALAMLAVRVQCFQVGNANGLTSFRLESRDPSSTRRVLEQTPRFPSHVQSNDSNGRLPTVLEQIVSERAEFQVNLGRAMDTLQSDMPYILKKSLDYSIYHDKLSLIDPSGVQLTGLSNYKSAISFLQGFHRFWFKENPHIQFRMVYDFCRSSIRISWHVVLYPKVPLGRPLHVDGISYYQLDAESGKITQHKIDNLLINNKPAIPPYGILSLLQQDAIGVKPQGAPVLGMTANGVLP